MLALYETPAGYALFKVLDKNLVKNVDTMYKEFATPEAATKAVKLAAFHKFEDTTSALAAATSMIEGKMDKGLKKFLKSNLADVTKLAVNDPKLGNIIKEKFDIKCIADDSALELLRGIRSQLEALLPGLTSSDKNAMKLGLSHSLCRYKLKFSPDKVDTMIIQAIALLDELDKELNTYAMRVREWYGWHFPEMGKIVTDTIMYAKVVTKMGVRSNASSTDLSDILPEDVETEVKAAAEVSMGTEISEEDTLNITELCDQVVAISEYRASLFDYLKNRMHAIAPNLSVMVGELVGARLIAHSGSLLSLAKQPASTIQILGAEKALFRALKTKHETPKYGLIYHASLVGQAAPKFKGRISRVLAAKTALSIRTDALGNTDGVTIALGAREKVENRLRELEGGKVHSLSGQGKSKSSAEKYQKPESIKTYNPAADVAVAAVEEDGEDEKKKKKKEKKAKKEKEEQDMDADAEEDGASKKKRKHTEESAENGDENGESDKKKKKKDKKKKKESSDDE